MANSMDILRKQENGRNSTSMQIGRSVVAFSLQAVSGKLIIYKNSASINGLAGFFEISGKKTYLNANHHPTRKGF
jgi:hypothetical protein